MTDEGRSLANLQSMYMWFLVSALLRPVSQKWHLFATLEAADRSTCGDTSSQETFVKGWPQSKRFQAIEGVIVGF